MRRKKPSLLICLLVLGLSACSTQGPNAHSAAAPVSLAAGAGEEVVEAQAGIPCNPADPGAQASAVRAALAEAVRRAAAAYGGESGSRSVDDLVVQHRVDRYWTQSNQCFASVQAVVRTSSLQRSAKQNNREELRRLGRPVVAFSVASYRIFPNTALTTRRSAAEVIDSLQQELITRGFDVRRSLKARNVTLGGGGTEVLDISSAEREQIAKAALKDGVTFLVQGEIKVTDQGQQGNGDFLAVVDGSLEAVQLSSDRIIGSFRDVATGQHVAASAAYTKAISGFARAAGAELADQMLDSWKSAD